MTDTGAGGKDKSRDGAPSGGMLSGAGATAGLIDDLIASEAAVPDPADEGEGGSSAESEKPSERP